MSLYVKTPLYTLTRINSRCGKNFQVKMECLQPTSSFKIRGISRVCEDAKANGIKRLICASGGNAGHAVAYSAKQLGMQCTIVMPSSASTYMVSVLKREGAEVIVCGSIFDEANNFAQELLANDPESFFVHPFDNPLLWEGHSTIVDELADQTDRPDAIVLSVGGGGLFNGVIQGMDRNGWGSVPVIACEVEGAPKFHLSFAAGKRICLDEIRTLANTLAGKTVSEKTVELARTHSITSCLITDERAANACMEFVEDFRILVELACGASMSVAYDLPKAVEPYQNIVIIACGGAGVNLPKLLEYKQIFKL